MRNAAGGRCARTAVGEVLHDLHDLPAVRHRDRVSRTMGARAARLALAGVLPDRRLLPDPFRGLHLKLAKRCARLGPRVRSRQQARAEARPRRGEEIPLWDSKLITKFRY